MIYKVVAVPDKNTVHAWDGTSFNLDEGHAMVPLVLTVPDHGFKVGDKVSLAIRKVEQDEQSPTVG